MGRADDIQELLEKYFDSWKTEALESQCWQRSQAGRITQLDDKLGGDYFRTDLQNALGRSKHYNVQTQPNAALRSSKNAKLQCLKLANGRSLILVLIHCDATPRSDVVREAFKSSCSLNKSRLMKPKEDLHTKVVIDADGGWNNEFAGHGKQAADHEVKRDLVLRSFIDELSGDQEGRIGDRWGEILRWETELRKKQRNCTMTDQNWADFENRLTQLKKDLS